MVEYCRREGRPVKACKGGEEGVVERGDGAGERERVEDGVWIPWLPSIVGDRENAGRLPSPKLEPTPSNDLAESSRSVRNTRCQSMVHTWSVILGPAPGVGVVGDVGRAGKDGEATR